MEFLSTVTDYSRNMMQPLGPLFSSTESMLTQPPESPVGPGWPAQVPTPGEYLLPPSQEQPPFGDSRRQAILPAEPEQTSYGPVGDRKVVQNLEGNPPYGLGQQFHSLPETYGALNSEGLSPQDQTTYPEKTAYMRPAPTHPYTNTPASWSIPREQAQRFIQPPLVEPSKPILAPTQYQPPHPEIRTPVYSQPRAGYSQATGPMNAHYGQPGNTPVQPANGYAIQSDNPATIIYVDVGVQTDPELFQPAIRPIGKTSGRAETTTGGQKFKFVQSTATGRSSGSTSASKRAPRSQKKLPPTQPALRLQTPSEPGPSLPEPHIDPTSVGSLGTSLEDRYTPRTLGPDHPPVIQGGTSNRSLSGSVPVLRGPPSAPSGSTCEASTLRAPEDTLPTPSAAPTRPVQQLHALPSPCISDAGVDQVLHGSAAPCDPIPLTRRVSPGISLQNCKASSSLHVPSLTSGGANCLPTPDPSPGVNGMDQRLVFPFEPLRHEQPEATTLRVSVSQTHQANDSHLAESSTAHQAGVQTQGPANTPLVVPPIHIFSPEDTISSPGRASNQGYAHAENNPDEAPQPRSQQGPKSGLTHRRANQFTQPSAQKRGNSIDHQLAAQFQRQPQGIHNVENHTEGKPRSTSAISQCDTNKLRQNQPGLVRRDGQRQAQACSPKRERSANETGPEQQTKRRREDKERQSSRDAGEGAPERSVPQAARTDNEPFDVNMWLNSRLSQVISEAEEHPVADTEDTSSQNQQQQGRMQAQSWGLGPKKPYAIGGSSMKHAPLPHTMPPPSSADNSSARVAILGAPTHPATSALGYRL
ncbi:hypothetical protein FS749_003889 [Ceratobasidium sp. UAMH 11750]|nr:hypothetical protein FS749_003889 [Ceratobasidium sp. UAMH 11750]